MDSELTDELKKLDASIAEAPSGRLYLRRGLLLWRMQKHAAAMADYERAIALDGPDSEAVTVLEMARSVMNFFNKDMYNP